METVRDALIGLLQPEFKAAATPLTRRVEARIVRDFLGHLDHPDSPPIGVHRSTLSSGSIHRHIFTLRCPDQAFFLDAIAVYLSRRGIASLGQQTLLYHPRRDPDGTLVGLDPPQAGDGDNRMLVALHVATTALADTADSDIERDLAAVLRSVWASVRDYDTMQRNVDAIAASIATTDSHSGALLAWMAKDNYLMLGMAGDGHRRGILADRRVLARIAPGLAEDLGAELTTGRVTPDTVPGLRWLFFPGAAGFVYGVAQLEVIRITWRAGRSRQAALLVGYFSRSARHANASQTPLVNTLWDRFAALPEMNRSAYLAREVRTLFNQVPKSFLIATPPEAMAAALCRVAMLSNPDDAQVYSFTLPPRRVTLVMVAVDGSRYGSDMARRVREAVAATGLEPLYHQAVAIGPRVLLFVSGEGTLTDAARDNLAASVRECVITWADRAREAIRGHLSGDAARRALWSLERVPRLYTDLFAPETFVADLAVAEQVGENGRPRVRVEADGDVLHLHLFTTLPVPLGNLVTIVRRFHLVPLKEVVTELPGETSVHVTILTCKRPDDRHPHALPRFVEALEAVLADAADNDPANALVLSAGMSIAAVHAVITLRNHLVQLAPAAGPGALTRTLTAHPAASAALYQLFVTQHHGPDAHPQEVADTQFDTALGAIQNLTDDRWFRALADLVRAGLRTNAWSRDAADPLAIKIDPGALRAAPSPRPYREIFVHGRHVEGVHLRGGRLARGGLRLSDRPSDFRTEVLELMATQVVKNGLIVPTGAKGGFVLRGGSGGDFIARCYRAYVGALLSVTDNRGPDGITPPVGVHVPDHDADDSYLVVAADKGTAQFSDLANAVAAENTPPFWLGDAFASGGSNGYDHKEYGITARGAWVSVCHHFAALGADPERDPVTVVGVGDMGGDVFGNGLLLSRTLRLVAAFNHRNIFLDPEPDPASAHRERTRLFAARLGWDAYDPACISKGGGVFPRSAKSITLSPAAAAALGTDPGEISGEALIRCILTAPVDLLYNGGIGTYVRASTESDEDAHDPANNAVRVSADQLRCLVVGEGGNLGFTQRARIEYAQGGGRINTDAVDNSGGVDMSDREVNLKLLLAHGPGTPTGARRNRLLADLGAEVTDLCLADNRNQSRTLALAEGEARAFPPRAQRTRDGLIVDGWIDPDVHPGMDEPGTDTLPLRPQLSVLLGQEKNRLQQSLVDAGFPTATPYREPLLADYLPRRIIRRFPAAVRAHPLADDIVATVAAGALVDRFGLFAVRHLEGLTGAAADAVAHALLAADDMLGGATVRHALWTQVTDPAETVSLVHALQEHLQRFAEELLHLGGAHVLSRPWIATQRRHLTRFRQRLLGEPAYENATQGFAAMGLSAAPAATLAVLPALSRAAVAVHVATTHNTSVTAALSAHRAVLDTLPFVAVDHQLRDPSWGVGILHELRAEWLHRLVWLRARAVRRVLSTGAALGTATARWQAHRHFAGIAKMGQAMAGTERVPRDQVNLLMARLESLVEDGDGR